jgi:hypothetical protein
MKRTPVRDDGFEQFLAFLGGCGRVDRRDDLWVSRRPDRARSSSRKHCLRLQHLDRHEGRIDVLAFDALEEFAMNELGPFEEHMGRLELAAVISLVGLGF